MKRQKNIAATRKKSELPLPNPNTLQLVQEPGKTKERQLAELTFSSSMLGAMTAKTFAYNSIGQIDITEAVSILQAKAKKVVSGDVADLETGLVAQAVALDTIFNEMARRAALNMGEHMPAMETYMRLAFKAQAQYTRTVEALSSIKNPSAIYTKQANIANGPQQINNGMAYQSEKFENELSGEQNEL